MASMASSYLCKFGDFYRRNTTSSRLPIVIVSQQQQQQQQDNGKSTLTTTCRREMILKTSEIAMFVAILNFSGKKPNYLGIQKNPPGLALCPATQNCVSTSENTSDLTHYAPPWNYNPDGKRGNVSREEAIEELVQVALRLQLEKKGWASENSF